MSAYDLENVYWFPFSDEPLIKGGLLTPKLCDPCFLFPEQAPDNRWHLFAHSLFFIHHFISTSGIKWTQKRPIVLRGHSPFIYKEESTYIMLYEKHDVRLLPRSISAQDDVKKSQKGFSRFEMIMSTDLYHWSPPQTILECQTISKAYDSLKLPRISRPQLFKTSEGYRMFFGASHILLDDTGQKVSRHFCTALSSSLDGPYTPSSEPALLSPDSLDKYRNLAAGSMKVIQCNDGFYGLECPIFWDGNKRRSSSAMVLMKSYDGISWSQACPKPILTTASQGWTQSYIMSADAHYKSSERCWYCYYSANGGNRRESIGLLLGEERR
ncbi:MAG: hypothetical protein PHI83_06560 [Sphaerochaetaceae bacterium]|jgi:hypothetical protein|nr:hypothetical protein [Sphaerochaetaceae bacterium]